MAPVANILFALTSVFFHGSCYAAGESTWDCSFEMPILHYLMVRFHELPRCHFAVEESLMRIIAFPDIVEHKRVHSAILQSVDRNTAAAAR